MLGRLAGVTAEAEQAEAALRQVVLWWDTGTIAAAQEQKAQLQAEVAALQANQDAWVKAGMLGKLERCGAKLRPCIRVDEGAGSFESQGHSDYRVIQGY